MGRTRKKNCILTFRTAEAIHALWQRHRRRAAEVAHTLLKVVFVSVIFFGGAKLPRSFAGFRGLSGGGVRRQHFPWFSNSPKSRSCCTLKIWEHLGPVRSRWDNWDPVCFWSRHAGDRSHSDAPLPLLLCLNHGTCASTCRIAVDHKCTVTKKVVFYNNECGKAHSVCQ